MTGTKTETLVQDYLFETKMGFTKKDGKYGSNNGFDGLFIAGTEANPTKIIITESKQQWNAGVQLNGADPNTGLYTQMSDDWVNDVAQRLINTGNPEKIALGDMIRNNPGLIEKYVITVNKSTGNINILKLGSF